MEEQNHSVAPQQRPRDDQEGQTPTKAEIKEATALLTDLIAQKGVDGTISCGSGHYIDLHNTSPLFRFVVSACGGIEKFVMSRRGVFEGCSPLGEIVLVGSINSVKNRIRSKNAKEWQEAVALKEKAKALKDEAVALLVDAIKRYGLDGSLSVRSKSYNRLHSPTMSNQMFKAAVKKCGGIKQLCESHKDLLEHSKGVITFVGEWDDSIKTTASLARPLPPRDCSAATTTTRATCQARAAPADTRIVTQALCCVQPRAHRRRVGTDGHH